MINKTFGLIILFIGVFQLGFSQIEEHHGTLIRPTHPGGIVEISQLPPPENIGSNYLYKAWKLGSVTLTDNRALENVPLKYDLKQNVLEVSSDHGIKVIYSEQIEKFELLSDLGSKEIYVNIDLFNSTDDLPSGFFEIIYDGKLSLVAKKNVEYIAPHYNQALDAGNTEGRYDIREVFFYIDTQDNALELPKKKKQFYGIFGTHSSEIAEYIKSRNLSIRERYALKKIFEYYNSIQLQ